MHPARVTATSPIADSVPETRGAVGKARLQVEHGTDGRGQSCQMTCPWVGFSLLGFALTIG
jgi:hypothetical protein